MAEFQRIPGIRVGSRHKKGIFQARDREFLVEKKRITDSTGVLRKKRMFEMAVLTLNYTTQEVVNAMIYPKSNPQNSAYPCYSPLLPMELFIHIDPQWYRSFPQFSGFRVIESTESVSKKENTEYALIAGVLDQRIRAKNDLPPLESFDFLKSDTFEFSGGDTRWKQSVQTLEREIFRGSSPSKTDLNSSVIRRRPVESSLFRDFARFFGVQIVVFSPYVEAKSYVPEGGSPPYTLIRCGLFEDTIQFLFYTKEEMGEAYIDPWTRQPQVCLLNRSVFDIPNPADFVRLLDVLYAFLLSIGCALQSVNSRQYKVLFDSILEKDSIDFIKKLKSAIPKTAGKRFFKRSCDPLYVALRICGVCKETEADLITDCGCAVCKKCLIRMMVEARDQGRLTIDQGDAFQPFHLTPQCAKPVLFSSVKSLLSPSDLRNLKEFPTCRYCSYRKKPMILSCSCVICELCGFKQAASTGQIDFCYLCNVPIPSQTRDRLRPHAALRIRA